MAIPKKLLLSMAIFAGSVMGFNTYAIDVTPSASIVSQNFDSMWDSNSGTPTLALPEGWKIDRNLVAPRQVGSWESASTSVMYSGGPELPANASNGSWNYGPQTSDRAVGGFTTTVANGTRCINVMTSLSNKDASKIITGLNLSYNIEMYRTCANAAGFAVSLYTSEDGTRWTQAGDSFYTLFPKQTETAEGATIVPISTTELKDLFLRTHVEPGKDLYLAWNISVASGTSPDKAPGLAIDDVVITATFADSDPDWVEEEKPVINPSGIYMRGVDGVWDAVDDWEFSKLSETEYALYNKTISGTFKVGDASWSSTCDYGTNGSNITMGQPYEMVAGAGNISCGSLSFNCSRILLTIVDGKATLTFEPNTSTTGLTAVYMVGDFNNWNYMDQSGKLTLDNTDNLFKGTVGLTAGSDNLSHWMIYQRLALAGAWGLQADATSPSTTGILVAGETGHVATEAGMYEVTFNIETGEYTLEKQASTATELVLHPSNVVLVPEVPETVKVLSLNNSLIHYNDQAKVFNDIAASMGKDAYWIKHTNLGKTLQYHWEEGDGMTDGGEPGAKMMIRSDAWSHIILQEQTILPRTDFESFRNSVELWVNYIRDNCPNPNAVIILPLNWALGQDWSNFTDYNNILADNYEKVAKEMGIIICPVGLAYQEKFNNDGGQNTETDWFLPGDDRHPTLKATYLAALMEYGLIYGEDPQTVSYYPSYTTDEDKVGEMNDAIASEMRGYASRALAGYRNIVDHNNATVNLSAQVIDQFGLEVPTNEISWTVEPASASITNGVFKATENGVYTITANATGLSATSEIIVASAITEVPEIPAIVLDNENLEYIQNFDSMGDAEEAAIPFGWRADGQLTPRTIGSFIGASETTLKAGGTGFGSTAKNGVWNLGSSSDENDRALGGITTDAAGGAKSINVYAHFVNEGSKYISSFDLGYNVEKYRDGSNAAGFSVVLYTSVDGKNWTPAGEEFVTSFDPSAETIGSEVVPMETKNVQATLVKDLAPGGELYFAWNISATSGESCMSAPVLAIDDFVMNATLRPVPEYDYHIYIENMSSYEKTGLYAWSSTSTPSEIFGAWPGQNPIDYVVIDNVNYEVFGHNQADGTYFLIYNNNNNGSQLNDLEVEGGRDYYLRATDEGLFEKTNTDNIVEMVGQDNTSRFVVTDNEVSNDFASSMMVFNASGSLVAKAEGTTVTISHLAKGIYIAVAQAKDGKTSISFVKK